MNPSGLTLIEILVAMSVLALGATGLLAMQLSTLRLAQQTDINTRLLHVADSELQLRLLGAVTGPACSAVPAIELTDMHCSVAVQGCSTSLGGFTCDGGAGGSPRRVTVTARVERGNSVTLSAVTRTLAGP